MWPHRGQPTRLLCPWDSPGKNTGVGCHFLLQCMKVKSESEVTQSCPTLRDPMDCSPPGSSVHGIFQARVLEWCHCFLLHDLANVGNWICGFSALSKSVCTSRSSQFRYCWNLAWRIFEHNLAYMWNEYSCAVVWTFFDNAFFWDWNENWPFPVLWPLLSFPNLLAYWVQHFHSIIF